MGDGDHRHVGPELRAQRRLNYGVGLIVWVVLLAHYSTTAPRARHTDGRRRLVEDKQLALTHDRARERDNLSLSDRQVGACACDRGVEREPVLVRRALEGEQSRRTQRVVQDCVVVLPEHVQVVPQGAAQQLRLRGRRLVPVPRMRGR